MRRLLATRLSIWFAIIRPGWRWLAIPVIGIFEAFTHIRDEFLPMQWQSALETAALIKYLPEMTWQLYTITAPVIAIVLVLEGAYREQEKLKKRFGVSGSSRLPLSLEFRDINSASDVQGSHYKAMFVLPPADCQSLEWVPTIREARIAVVNNSENTIDDVSLHVTTICQGTPENEPTRRNISWRRRQAIERLVWQSVDISLPQARSGSTTISIGPKRTGYIVIVSAVEKHPVPTNSGHLFKSWQMVEELIRMADLGHASLGATTTGHKILRNDDVKIRVELTGRNVPLVRGSSF